MDFSVPADHWVKLNESEKRNVYLDLACETEEFWRLKETRYQSDSSENHRLMVVWNTRRE